MNAGDMFIVLIALVVGIVCLFAQVKLFAISSAANEAKNRLLVINSTLEALLMEMRKPRA